MLLLRVAGAFRLRVAERQLLPLLFREPPRSTRTSVQSRLKRRVRTGSGSDCLLIKNVFLCN
jgi:hypothetical protein